MTGSKLIQSQFLRLVLIINVIIDYFFILFQRMDLGECPKIHDLALRADYQQAASARDCFYDVEVSPK